MPKRKIRTSRTRTAARSRSTTTRRTTKTAPKRIVKKTATRATKTVKKVAAKVRTATAPIRQYTQRVAPQTTTDWLANQTFKTVNEAIHGLEEGATYTYRAIKDLTGFDANKWFKNWQGWATGINAGEIVNIAHSQKYNFEKDLSRVAKNVQRAYRSAMSSWLPQGEEFLRDAKRNLWGVYRVVRDSEWVHWARTMAYASRDELFTLLNIPSQEEVEQLQRKFTTLEQRLTTVMLRGAKNR